MGKSKRPRCVIVFAELPFGVPSTPPITYHNLVCYRRRVSAVLVVQDDGPFLDSGETTGRDASPIASGGAGTRGSTTKYMALVHYAIDGLYLLDKDEEMSARFGWVEVTVDASQDRDVEGGCMEVGVRKSLGEAAVIVEVPAHAILTVRACVGVGVGVVVCVPTPMPRGTTRKSSTTGVCGCVIVWVSGGVCVGVGANATSDDTEVGNHRCVCVCVWVRVCVCVGGWVCMCVGVGADATSDDTLVRNHKCVCVCVWVCACALACVCVCAFVRARVCAALT